MPLCIYTYIHTHIDSKKQWKVENHIISVVPLFIPLENNISQSRNHTSYVLFIFAWHQVQ